MPINCLVKVYVKSAEKYVKLLLLKNIQLISFKKMLFVFILSNISCNRMYLLIMLLIYKSTNPIGL